MKTNNNLKHNTMTRDIQTMTEELFREHLTSPEKTNRIASAHSHLDQNSVFKYKATCDYPTSYIVTEEQIKEAQELRAANKAQALKNIKNKLVFVSMATRSGEPIDPAINSHRIRTEFKNDRGRHFFIEFVTGINGEPRISFSIDRDLENKCNTKRSEIVTRLNDYQKNNQWDKHREALKELRAADGQPYYNYANLQKNPIISEWNLEKMRNLINREFGCSYLEVEVDHHYFGTDDFICTPPPYELKYIVNTKDFKGRIETTFMHWEGKSIDECFADYSNKSVRDYLDGKALQGIDLEVLTAEQTDKLIDKYHKSLQGDWKEITENQYFEALEVLPPQNWHSLSPQFSMFYCMEAYTGSLHSFYIEDKINNKFYSALRDKYVKDSSILLELNKIK